MELEDKRRELIAAQYKAVAPVIRDYANSRAVKSQHARDHQIELLIGLMHAADQTGVNFTDALNRARVTYLEQKRPIK